MVRRNAALAMAIWSDPFRGEAWVVGAAAGRGGDGRVGGFRGEPVQRTGQPRAQRVRADDQPGLARTLDQLGVVAQARQDCAKARENYERSLEISTQLNLQSDIAGGLRQLSLLARETGDSKEADSLVQQGEAISEDLDWLVPLRRYLAEVATEDELRSVSMEFGIDYDDLPGRRSSAKAGELVSMAYRQGRLGELVEIGRETFPDMSDALDA